MHSAVLPPTFSILVLVPRLRSLLVFFGCSLVFFAFLSSILWLFFLPICFPPLSLFLCFSYLIFHFSFLFLSTSTFPFLFPFTFPLPIFLCLPPYSFPNPFPLSPSSLPFSCSFPFFSPFLSLCLLPPFPCILSFFLFFSIASDSLLPLFHNSPPFLILPPLFSFPFSPHFPYCPFHKSLLSLPYSLIRILHPPLPVLFPSFLFLLFFSLPFLSSPPVLSLLPFSPPFFLLSSFFLLSLPPPPPAFPRPPTLALRVMLLLWSMVYITCRQPVRGPVTHRRPPQQPMFPAKTQFTLLGRLMRSTPSLLHSFSPSFLPFTCSFSLSFLTDKCFSLSSLSLSLPTRTCSFSPFFLPYTPSFSPFLLTNTFSLYPPSFCPPPILLLRLFLLLMTNTSFPLPPSPCPSICSFSPSIPPLSCPSTPSLLSLLPDKYISPLPPSPAPYTCSFSPFLPDKYFSPFTLLLPAPYTCSFSLSFSTNIASPFERPKAAGGGRVWCWRVQLPKPRAGDLTGVGISSKWFVSSSSSSIF
ncbi:hypothetical protein C7M84_016469 [Penaeus vannamei]|uniref:Uncharacterized protein n=1 Tax=Penaeus vannamei TaxID=6689 RepID=A0A423SMW8_PENVA|nr:hypothetical protein C7M84_016469 [Penaeus vannamei]